MCIINSKGGLAFVLGIGWEARGEVGLIKYLLAVHAGNGLSCEINVLFVRHKILKYYVRGKAIHKTLDTRVNMNVKLMVAFCD